MRKAEVRQHRRSRIFAVEARQGAFSKDPMPHLQGCACRHHHVLQLLAIFKGGPAQQQLRSSKHHIHQSGAEKSPIGHLAEGFGHPTAFRAIPFQSCPGGDPPQVPAVFEGAPSDGLQRVRHRDIGHKVIPAESLAGNLGNGQVLIRSGNLHRFVRAVIFQDSRVVAILAKRKSYGNPSFLYALSIHISIASIMCAARRKGKRAPVKRVAGSWPPAAVSVHSVHILWYFALSLRTHVEKRQTCISNLVC